MLSFIAHHPFLLFQRRSFPQAALETFCIRNVLTSSLGECLTDRKVAHADHVRVILDPLTRRKSFMDDAATIHGGIGKLSSGDRMSFWRCFFNAEYFNQVFH